MKKTCLLAVVSAAALSFLHATASAASTAADLLNEAVWWPGDIGQIDAITTLSCRSRNPPIPGYGTCIPQVFHLSAATLAKLQSQRDAVIVELQQRLHAFSWEKPPPAPPVTEQVKSQQQDAVQKWPGKLPSGQMHENPLALGATTLRIIEALQAVELLPELLRLEEDIQRLNESALDATWIINSNPVAPPPTVLVPDIQTGGKVRWINYEEDSADYAGPQQAVWMAWKEKVFGNLVFQREIIGVCLGMLDKNGFQPLRGSFIDRLHALSAKRQPVALIPWSDTVRDEARLLIRSFADGKQIVDDVDGVHLLEDAIQAPGSWDQMCGMPPPIPLDTPMPVSAELARRYFNLGWITTMRLQAYRERVMPVLLTRLQAMKIASVAAKNDIPFSYKRSGQTSTEFGPLIFQVVECLNAVECLPELLRLEQRFHDLVAQAEKDPGTPVPLLRLDSPSAWQPPRDKDNSPETKALQQRQTAIHICRIYQREMLGLIRSILLMEQYQPMQYSALEQNQKQAGRAAFREEHQKEIDKIKSATDIPEWLRSNLVWNEQEKRADIAEHASYAVPTPYSADVRDEILRIAAAFLKNIPPAQRKAADGMHLSWLPQ